MAFQITACININELVSGYENGDRLNRTTLSSDRGIFHTFNENASIIMEDDLAYGKIDYISLFAIQISWSVPKERVMNKY